MKRFFSHSISILLFLVNSTSALFASGERASIAHVSMGRASVASARGLEAIGTNPANLTLPHRERTYDYSVISVTHDTVVATIDSLGNLISTIQTITHDSIILRRNAPPTVAFQFAPFGFGLNFGTDLINFDIYEEYFTGVPDIDGDGKRDPRHLTDEDKNRILEIFPGGIAETHFNFDVRLFGLTFHHDVLGNIGITITDRVSFNFNLPKDYARFVLFGLDSLGSFYDMSGTAFNGWYLREYALSYARAFPKLWHIRDFAAGVSLKVIHGYAAIITDRYNATFSNQVLPDYGYSLNGNIDFRMVRSYSDNFSANGTFSPFPKSAGKGIGVDVGVCGEVMQGIRAGISFVNLGSIRWTENTNETFGSASISMTNITFQTHADSIENLFKGEDQPTAGFSTPLPTSMRLGSAVQVDQLPFISWFPGQLLVSVEYHQGFNQSPGNTTRARIGFGMEYRPILWFPLRTGISVGGADRFNWAAGFGFDFGGFNLNFGTENIGILTSPSNYDQLSFGLGMIIRVY